MAISQPVDDHFPTYQDCLSENLLRVFDCTDKGRPKSRSKKRKNPRVRAKGDGNAQLDNEEKDNDPKELGEFIEYLAHEIFDSLPPELQTLSYVSTQRDADLAERYSLPLSLDALDIIISCLPQTVSDTLTTYSLLPPSQSLNSFLAPSFQSYISAVTTPPPPYLPNSRSSECEICARDWIPLTYHHLIPRSTHDRVLKRGWHEDWELESVAWLCRACHSFVHRIAKNEELAREWYTVERLLEREDVRDWATWIGRVRWKKG